MDKIVDFQNSMYDSSLTRVGTSSVRNMCFSMYKRFIQLANLLLSRAPCSRTLEWEDLTINLAWHLFLLRYQDPTFDGICELRKPAEYRQCTRANATALSDKRKTYNCFRLRLDFMRPVI